MPELRQIDDLSWRHMTEIIEHAIAQRPPAVRRQLAAFLHVLNLLSLAQHGRTLSSLIPSMRTQLLEGVQDSRLLLFRRGFWGLRTLILMGYYARPEARTLVGYRAHISGWQAR